MALLAASASLGAQEPRTCPVPADDAWTPQEKFVWAHVCNGDKADFNKEAAYGGNVDARTAALPETRVLRKAFIETILINDRYRSAITRHGVRVSGARFVERIDLQNAELRYELWFEQCLFENGADLSWLQSTQPIAFNTSKVTGALTLYAAHATDLSITGSEVASVNLLGAHVDHTLNLTNSTITGMLQMDSLQIGVYLHMRRARFAEVNLLGAHVQNQVTLEGAKVTGALDMFDIQIGTDLWMNDSEFFGTVKLRNAQIGGQLGWNRTTFHQNVDLTGARVVGAFQLGATKWLNNGTLTARYAKLGVIPRLSAAWPPKMEIDGLTYAGIEAVGEDFEKWFDKLPRYSRPPYEQLANVLQAQGDIEKATAVRFAERDRDRDRTDQPWSIFAWLTLLRWLIGYGYYPYYSIWWIVGFVALGAVVLRVSGQGPRNAMPIGLSYSFDMLLPVIRLREQHYAVDLTGAPRYYFYCHKIMGWVLASFLVAGLSGLTK